MFVSGHVYMDYCGHTVYVACLSCLMTNLWPFPSLRHSNTFMSLRITPYCAIHDPVRVSEEFGVFRTEASFFEVTGPVFQQKRGIVKGSQVAQRGRAVTAEEQMRESSRVFSESS